MLRGPNPMIYSRDGEWSLAHMLLSRVQRNVLWIVERSLDRSRPLESPHRPL
jgi:hypothetical protein